MMEISTVANIAEIAGGIAILISLTYAGFQIRQSNRIAKVESIRSIMNNSFVDKYDMSTIGRGFNSFDSLDKTEKWEFHRYFLRFLNHYTMVVQTRELGLIEEISLDAWTKVVAESITTSGGRQYWESGARDSNDPSIVKRIEEYIRDNSSVIIPYNQRLWTY